jgi:PAS domain S-box-containing protein
MKLSTSQLINFGFALAIFLLVAVGWLAFSSTRQYIASVEARREAHNRIGLATELLGTISKAEIGHRGYLLFDDSDQLAQYKFAIRQWPSQLAQLRQRLADTPDDVSQLRHIEELSIAKIEELERAVHLRLEHRPEAEVELQRLLTHGESARSLRELRQACVDLQLREENRHKLLVTRVDDSARRSLFTVALLSPLSVILVMGAALVINHELQKRQHATEEVQQQKVVLSAVLDSLNEGVIIIDEQGHLIHFNPAARRMHGGLGASDSSMEAWSRDYGLYLPDKITPYPVDQLPSVRALRGERVPYCELYQRRNDEAQGRMFSNTAAPIIDETGQQRGGVVVVVDITEAHAAEDRLRHSEEAYRDLYDRAPCGYYSINEQYTIVAMNATALQWLGYSAEEVIGKMCLLDMLSPDDREPFRGRFASFLQTGTALDVVQVFQRRDGSTFPTLLRATAVRDAAGNFLHTRTTILDLTERRAAERRFQSLIESAPDAMIIVNALGEIVLVNSRTEQLFGYSRREMLGRAVEMLLPERYRATHAIHRNDYFATPQVRQMGAGEELFGQRADGREFPIEVSLAPVDAHPDPWICAVVRDVTDQRALLRRLREWNEQLELHVSERTQELAHAIEELSDRNQEIELFVYSVSHDLRSPLVNLQGFSQELASSCEQLRAICESTDVPTNIRSEATTLIDGDVRESLHFIRNAVQRLSGIIDALLRLSRAGRVEYQWQALDSTAIANSVVDALRGTIQERQAKVHIFPLDVVWGDATAIEQVFANLLANALNYLDPQRPGKIELGTLAPEDGPHPSWKTFYVRDNGVGIPAELQAKVFVAFQRLSPKLAAGEGMGLTLVQRIVERHGGQIWVESATDVGSTFYFTLPTSADAPSHADFKVSRLGVPAT